MKKLVLFFICAILSGVGTLSASNHGESSVLSLKQDSVIFIRTIDDAILYKLNNADVVNFSNETQGRSVVDLEGCRKKRLRKSTQLELFGYQNRDMQFYFDTYVVKYGEKLYYLPSEFVEDNTQLTRSNKALDNIFSSLTNKRDSIAEALRSAEEEIDSYHKLCKEREAYFSRAVDSLPAVIDSVGHQAALRLEAENEAENNKRFQAWYNTLPYSTKRAVKTIRIDNAELSSANSAGGCDYSFTYTNRSTKTIKYLTWCGWVYNEVDDMVSCEIRGSSYVSGRDTGPVEPNNEYSAGGIWGDVIYNYSAYRVELSSIDIIFMDNTSVTISKSDIKRMQDEPERSHVAYSDIQEAKRGASSEYRAELQSGIHRVTMWRERASIIESTDNLQNIGYRKRELVSMPDCQALSDKLHRLQGELEAQNIRINNFKRNNFLDSTTNALMVSQAFERQRNYEYESKLIKRVTWGIGLDWLMSYNYMGASLPLEIMFGDINQRFNFSIGGSYTSLGSSTEVSIHQASPVATLYYNMGRSEYLSFPISCSVGYNYNLGSQSHNVTGYYYNDDYDRVNVSAPILVNKNNYTSTISIGMRGKHCLLSMYARFDLTPMYDKTIVNASIPRDELVFYDDILIEDIIDASDYVSLFGLSFRYYF